MSTSIVPRPEPIRDGTLLHFGEQTFMFGKEVVELQDSSALMGDFDALRQRMKAEGYLFLRGFHPRDKASQAALVTLEAIGERGGLASDTAISEGMANAENKSFGFFRDVEISHSPAVLEVVDGPHTFRFFEQFLGGPVITFDKRWLRAMAQGGSNFFHYDSAYVGRGTLNRYTMWSALTDIDLENGPLVICLGSHKDERLKQTYGQIDMDRDLIDPVFSKDAYEMVHKFGFKLATAHFQPGDVIIFGLFMMHSSVPNLTNRYRISIDTRYQLAADEKDERFFGEQGNWMGNFYNKGATYTPIEKMRAEWQLD
ncbi:MAG: phytanoyl-CoA dioxygenase family protein [Abitibacteriaceae bacterium]|nr:phytanoyl-CoA dioxygenase family protein [Abditibacteriaceae bacterium]